MRGFSSRNLKYMRALAQAFSAAGICATARCTITVVACRHAARQAGRRRTAALVRRKIARARLVAQRADHADRDASAVTNFADRLPPQQSDLARDALKDPYIFDFLGLTENAQERDIERALTQHITRFLLEPGTGWRSAVTSFSSTCFSII
ncbi:hypothetical protein QFZ94_006826 [Paraburkholderia sp. JPY465]